MINLDCLEKANCYPLKYIDDKKNTKDKSMHILSSDNELNDGITDFIHNLAKEKYGVPSITKEDIFYYVYGFLHDLNYRKKFESDLKKEIPKLPLVEEYENERKKEKSYYLGAYHLFRYGASLCDAFISFSYYLQRIRYS